MSDVVFKNRNTPWCGFKKPRHSTRVEKTNHVTPTVLLGQTTSLLQIVGANQVTPTNLWGKSGYFYDSLGQILTQSQNPLDMLQIPQGF